MRVRSFRPDDAPALAALAASCSRGESDFVLNPMWESEDELLAEFARHGISAEEHLLVADAGDGQHLGMVGFVRDPGAAVAGLIVPVVERRERGHGLGGELLRAGIAHAREKLGIRLVSAAVGARNHAGYSLLASSGFRPARQHFLMRLDQPPKAGTPPAPELRFELATPNDAQAILDLYQACGFETRTHAEATRVIADAKHATAVARRAEDGAIVAFAELETHWPRRVWVAYVGVDASLRDRGVGSALVEWALEKQFDAGAQTALLLLSPANRTALRAYEKAGFRRHRMVDVLQKLL